MSRMHTTILLLDAGKNRINCTGICAWKPEIWVSLNGTWSSGDENGEFEERAGRLFARHRMVLRE